MAARRRKRKKQETFTDAARARTDLLIADLLQRAEQEAGVAQALKAGYAAEKKAGRTGETFSQWRRMRLTQVAAAWVLSCTFVRTLEDRGLIARARIASQDGSAHDSEQQFYGLFPFLGPADYLLAVFRELARFPGLQDVFDKRHNPVWHLSPSPDAARELLAFLRDREGEHLRWTFDAKHGDRSETRFLGDLYQDLNTDVQKRYALLQTPEFVEELILEETLDPAIARFGLEDVKLLDPTCGSGHFLLGAFDRLLEEWHRKAPAPDAKARVEKALSQVHGADINPYAVAIARFRLVLAATVAAGIERLDADDAPHWPVKLGVCNSLLVRERQEQRLLEGEGFQLRKDEAVLAFELENADEINAVFGQRFQAVVGNPPYITEKDPVLRDAVRKRYASAAGKYALAAPFTERIFQLACDEGHIGMINTNAWTKREFGKALIEQVLPKYRLNLVVDTSGAYIPGHGTPTLLLFGQHAAANGAPVRTVQGKRGEPSTPRDPEQGLVWSSIREHRRKVGYEDDFVSVVDTPVETFGRHPWSLGGGGAAGLKEHLDLQAESTLSDHLGDTIGFASFPGTDDAFVIPEDCSTSSRIRRDVVRPFVDGESVRDWSIRTSLSALACYEVTGAQIDMTGDKPWLEWFWPLRRSLGTTTGFGGKTRAESGDIYWTWYRWVEHRYRTPLSIAFAFVATHNHFVLDRGGKVFKQSAPVIKLKPEATEDDHLALLGLLNSSVACFWMQQVFHCKGGPGGAASKDEKWHDFYEHDGTKIKHLPLPEHFESVLPIARELDALAESRPSPHALPQGGAGKDHEAHLKNLSRRIALQEELDWHCYRLFDLCTDSCITTEWDQVPHVRRGERAFEIVLARRQARGEIRTRWFEIFKMDPVTDPSSRWPSEYQAVVQRRIDLIESDRNIGLLEQPNYKRRWNVEPWDQQVDRALRTWLLRRLESEAYWPSPDSPALRPLTLAQLADKAAHDPEFHDVAARLRGSETFDVDKLVAEIALPEGVPVQSACRYKPSGLEKRRDWERTWEQQRTEDRGEDVGEIPVPPKYKSSDFQKSDYWRLRGKLDVPKETFLLYPHCGKGGEVLLDSTLLGWAGWDHLQQAKALATLYLARRDEDGWERDEILPILVALSEVLPWVLQWHNEPDAHGQRAGDAYQAFLEEEMRRFDVTEEQLQGWAPPDKGRTRKKAKREKDEKEQGD